MYGSCSVSYRIDIWILLFAVQNTWLEHRCHHHDVYCPLTHLLKHGPGAELAPDVAPPPRSFLVKGTSGSTHSLEEEPTDSQGLIRTQCPGIVFLSCLMGLWRPRHASP